MNNDLLQIFFIEDIWTLIKQHIYPTKKVCNYYQYQKGDIAALYGYFKLIQTNNNLVFTSIAMDWAAENGHFEIIKWLHCNRKEGCTNDAMNRAAGNGHLEIVNWLHYNKKRCTTDAMFLAAGNGHIIVNMAVRYNQLEILKWLHENKIGKFTNDIIKIIINSEYINIDMIMWLNVNEIVIKRNMLDLIMRKIDK